MRAALHAAPRPGHDGMTYRALRSSAAPAAPPRSAHARPRPPSPCSWGRGAAARRRTSRRAAAGSAGRAAPPARSLRFAKVSRSHASNFFLCAAPIFIAGWPGMLASSAEVRRKPQPFHLGCRAERARLRKIASTLRRQAAVGLVEPLPEQREIGLIAAGEIGRHQVVLAPEMIIQRPLGDAGLRRHRVDADAADAVIVEQRVRRRDDALTRVGIPDRAMTRMYTDQ